MSGKSSFSFLALLLSLHFCENVCEKIVVEFGFSLVIFTETLDCTVLLLTMTCQPATGNITCKDKNNIRSDLSSGLTAPAPQTGSCLLIYFYTSHLCYSHVPMRFMLLWGERNLSCNSLGFSVRQAGTTLAFFLPQCCSSLTKIKLGLTGVDLLPLGTPTYPLQFLP